jgi:hypothetical protein
LKELREAFAKVRRGGQEGALHPNEFSELVEAIERALFTFESTSNHALMRLYRRTDISATPSCNSVISSMEENVVLGGGDNETVFLVYLCVAFQRLAIISDITAI